MNNMKFSQWILMYFSFIGITLFIGFAFFVFLIAMGVMSATKFKVDATSSVFQRKKSQIAVVELQGAIMDAKDTIEKLHWATEHKHIKGIIFRVDSPGGSVGPSQEIYEEIARIVDKDNPKRKPIYVSMGNIAASGGYYVSIPATKICANEGSITGSIGVFMEFMDLSRVFDWLKIHPNVIKAGKYKTAGASHKPMTNEEKEIYQKLVESTHGQFINAIKKYRSTIIQSKGENSLENLTQGQVFNGLQAYQLGLVDELTGLWGCARLMQKDLKLPIGGKEENKLHFVELDSGLKWRVFLDKLNDVMLFMEKILQVLTAQMRVS